MAGPVEDYLAAIVAHDWVRLADLVDEDVVRVGPYGDTYAGRSTYVDFLAGLMPTLPGYAMDVARVTYADDGRRAFAELSETALVDGALLVTPEVLVMDVEGERITSITIYLGRSPVA